MENEGGMSNTNNNRNSSTMKRFLLFLTIIAQLLASVNAFSTGRKALASSSHLKSISISSSRCNGVGQNHHHCQGLTYENGDDHGHNGVLPSQRRPFLKRLISSTAGATLLSFGDGLVVPQNNGASAAPTTRSNDTIDTILSQLKEARSQLDPVENLIKEEKWDSVRAILIKPPLSDCWAKTSRPLLKLYADVMDELPNGDELAVLELREEALDHLRFLDMAVYNNVFNPIKTEGETGATKELIRSYYEDPVKEFNACKRILDDLIALANP